jgi:hypothetical protein
MLVLDEKMKNSPEKPCEVSRAFFPPCYMAGGAIRSGAYTLSLGPDLNAAFNGTLDNLDMMLANIT